MHVASWSGGKDSTATIILCHELGLPLDLILFSEVMYDAKRGISGEHPRQIKWMREVAIPKFEEWGYKTEILHADGKKKDFLDLFFHVIQSQKSKFSGKLTGFMVSGCCWANSALKVAPIKKRLSQLKKEDKVIQYIGIAKDEPKRLERLKEGRKSVLAEHGINEADTYEICRRYNLLSPLYETSRRGGVLVLPQCKTATNC